LGRGHGGGRIWGQPIAALRPQAKSLRDFRLLSRQVTGTRRVSASGRMTTTSNGGNFYVVGRFRRDDDDDDDDDAAAADDFKLSLSTNVSNADFQLGYCMTGTLERGRRADGRMEMTHYAMIKRKGY